MPPENVALEITLTSADAAALRRDYFKRRWPEWAALFVPLAAYLLYLFFLQRIAAVMLYEHGWDYDLAWSVTFWGGIILFFGTIVFAVRTLRRMRQRRSLAFQGYRLTISPDGIRMARDGLTSDIAWRIVHAVRHGRGRTFIYIDAQTAYVVPRRVFSSDADFAGFREMATRHFREAHSAT